MQQKNFAKSLAAFQKRTPFRPFVVELVNGVTIVVEHPEALRYQGQGTAVYMDRHGTITLFDHEGVANLTDARQATSKT